MMIRRDTPQNYIRDRALWEISACGGTCTGNIIVSVDPVLRWDLEVSSWYELVHKVFGEMVEERRIEVYETAQGRAIWYRFPNALQRIVTALEGAERGRLLQV
jgi:hypothetical protein